MALKAITISLKVLEGLMPVQSLKCLMRQGSCLLTHSCSKPRRSNRQARHREACLSPLPAPRATPSAPLQPEAHGGASGTKACGAARPLAYSEKHPVSLQHPSTRS